MYFFENDYSTWSEKLKKVIILTYLLFQAQLEEIIGYGVTTVADY